MEQLVRLNWFELNAVLSILNLNKEKEKLLSSIAGWYGVIRVKYAFLC